MKESVRTTHTSLLLSDQDGCWQLALRRSHTLISIRYRWRHKKTSEQSGGGDDNDDDGSRWDVKPRTTSSTRASSDQMNRATEVQLFYVHEKGGDFGAGGDPQLVDNVDSEAHAPGRGKR